LTGTEGLDFVSCRICGDRRRVISGRHLSKHDTDRETYIEEYQLGPDNLVAKAFRVIQSSRGAYKPYGKTDWIIAIRKMDRAGASILARDLQRSRSPPIRSGRLAFWRLGQCASGRRFAVFHLMCGRRSTVTKAEIITRICEKHGFAKNDATSVVEATFEIIKEILETGEKVKISNFGNFAVRTKNARRGRNPYTGAEIAIPQHKVLSFTPSPAMKETVNAASSA
jgi:integration host factor alpha subunit